MSAVDPHDTKNWRCTGCGCTDVQACPGGCSWVGVEICSACAAIAMAPEEPMTSTRLLINHDTWAVLPGEVLPRDEDGCVTHVIYSATVYQSVPLTAPLMELPALVAIPQANLSQALANVRSIDKATRSPLHDRASAELVMANIRNELDHLQQLLGLAP